MDKILIGGKELLVGYNMGVACDFEVESGEVFDLGSSFVMKRNQMILLWCALRRFNEGWPLTCDEMLDVISFDESLAADKAMGKAVAEFYKLPERSGDTSPETKEDATKNA